ncbi:Autophagy specific phophatidylinositol 3-kinase complex subunit Atg14 [Schizosaccharomyces pombe]
MSLELPGNYRLSRLKSIQIRNVQEIQNHSKFAINTTENLWKRDVQLKRAISEGTIRIFISLHVQSKKLPVYITETSGNANHIFYVDEKVAEKLQKYRHEEYFIVRTWCSSSSHAFKLHKEWKILRYDSNFRYIGNDPVFAVCHIRNGLLCEFNDGVYIYTTSQSSDIMRQTSFPKSASTYSIDRRKDGYTIQKITRILKLAECIDEMHIAKHEIRAHFQEEEFQQIRLMHKRMLLRDEKINELAKLEHLWQKKINSITQMRTKFDKTKSWLSSKRNTLNKSKESLQKDEAEYVELANSLKTKVETNIEIRILMAHAIRMHVSHLSKIYPIQPSPGNHDEFTIRNLRLSFEPDKINNVEMAASIGFLAHLLQTLSKYLEKELAYPILCASSRSSILDTLTPDIPTRIFPLYPATRPIELFEHAIYLLNQDVNDFLETFGLPIDQPMDILRNFKKLLQFILSGQHLSFVQVTSTAP